MIDEIKANKDSARGVRAQSLLDNELFVEAFKYLQDTYTNRMLDTNMGQGEEREKLYLAIRVLREVKRHISGVVTDGKLAQAELKQLAETAERKNIFRLR